MPESTSGYDTQLEVVEGDVDPTELSNGLFYAMGFGDYYGYTFFFDNDGVLRYEMVLEGYHSDRFCGRGRQPDHLCGQSENRPAQPLWPGDPGV